MNSQYTVLLADDDENDSFLMRRAFAKAKLSNSVVCVKDGDEVVAYLAGEGKYWDRQKYPLPQLLFLDLKMPRRSGFEVINWVRQQPGLKRLPIVVLTSSKQGPDINRAYELGANTYLVKPIKFESLLQMIKSVGGYWFLMAEKPIDYSSEDDGGSVGHQEWN